MIPSAPDKFIVCWYTNILFLFLSCIDFYPILSAWNSYLWMWFEILFDDLKKIDINLKVMNF